MDISLFGHKRVLIFLDLLPAVLDFLQYSLQFLMDFFATLPLLNALRILIPVLLDQLYLSSVVIGLAGLAMGLYNIGLLDIVLNPVLTIVDNGPHQLPVLLNPRIDVQ